MPVPWKLLPASLIDRPNRFLTRVRFDHRVVAAHLPDPGRLRELLLPGAPLLVQYNPGPGRKTDYTVHMVRRPDASGWVGINTLLPNRFVEFMLTQAHAQRDRQSLPFLKGWSLVRREVREGHSRFDFLLERQTARMFLEVKSVTYAEGGVAQFPDAVSVRGARHVRHLAALARQGQEAMVLFVIQREDARSFRPMWDRDPDVGRALVEAQKAGVRIEAIKLVVSPDSYTCLGTVPVDLTPPAG